MHLYSFIGYTPEQLHMAVDLTQDATNLLIKQEDSNTFF